MKRFRVFVYAILLASVFAFLGACAGKTEKKASGKIKVVTTILALEDIVKFVGDDRVDVVSIVSGMDNPHTFSLKPENVRAVQNADLFVEVGLGLEPWTAKLKSNIKAMVLTVGNKVPVKIDNNPHVWLSRENIKSIAYQVSVALSKIRSSSAKTFKQRADEFAKKVDAVFDEYAGKIASLKNRKVVADLPAFNYLLSDLGVNLVEVIIKIPGSETSGKRVLEIINLMNEENVKVIVHSILFDRKVPSVIAQQVGGTVVDLTPMPGIWSNAVDCISMIEYNAGSIYEALAKNQ